MKLKYASQPVDTTEDHLQGQAITLTAQPSTPPSQPPGNVDATVPTFYGLYSKESF